MNAKLFCSSCNKTTTHTISLSPNKEIDFKCACGRFVRSPDSSPNGVKAFIAAHNAANKPTKSAAEANAEHEKILKALEASGVVASVG